MGLNDLERDNFVRQIARLEERVKGMERFFRGTPIDTVRIKDAAITTAKIENAAITTAKIDSITWDQAQGGTAILGGSANGDGILQIKNASAITIIQGDKDGHHYYNTSSQELVKIDSTGLHGYNTSGVEQVRISASDGIAIYGSIGQSLLIKDTPGGSTFGILGYDSGPGELLFASATSRALHLRGALGMNVEVVSGDMNFNTNGGNFRINGSTKSAIVKTSKGYNALYCTESPEVWFFDFARIIRPRWWQFWKKPEYIVDNLFMETIEGISIVMPTLNPDIVQIWGKRKGYAKVRFEKKTKKDFDKNNNFWNIPKK